MSALISPAVISAALALGSAAQAVPIQALRAPADQCLQSGAAAVCRQAMERSHRLKQQAENRQELRCYTALLGLEAGLAMAVLGERQPEREQTILNDAQLNCR